MAWFTGHPFAGSWTRPWESTRRPGRSCWHYPDSRPRLLTLSLGGGEGVEQLAEFGEFDGLGEVGQRAVGKQAADDALGGVGGKDHYGNGGGGGFGLEFTEYLVSVQVRQMQVEQDDIGHVLGGVFEAG